MAQAPRKLGILLSVSPPHPNFHHALQLATAGLNAQYEVYIYCLDDAVHGLADERASAETRRIPCEVSAQNFEDSSRIYLDSVKCRRS